MAEALATVSRVDGIGMISLRADPEQAGPVLSDVMGFAAPEARQITGSGDRRIGWMSPDEFLCLMPRGEVAQVLQALEQGLSQQHALAVDMSDARVIHDVTGPNADDVLAKLSPANLGALGPHELRRSRAAQTAAAFWRIDGGFRIIGFRSSADYLGLLLKNAALPGSYLAPR